MRLSLRLPIVLAIASALSLAGCEPTQPVTTSDPSTVVATGASAAKNGVSPQESAVREAMEEYKQAVLDRDIPLLQRIWNEDYTFINPNGGIANRAQRIANLTSGNTNLDVIDNEREITVRVYGDMAVVQNLSTLHGQFNGVPVDTHLRGTFVWVRRDGRWRLVTNQLTAVTP